MVEVPGCLREISLLRIQSRVLYIFFSEIFVVSVYFDYRCRHQCFSRFQSIDVCPRCDLVELCIPAMSMPKSSSPEHDRELQFLRSLQNEGRLQALLCEVLSTRDEIGLLSTGSMHDGSKRRLDSWEEIDMVSDAQSPVVSKVRNSKTGVSNAHPEGIPPGVTSLKHWGDSLNTMFLQWHGGQGKEGCRGRRFCPA